MKTLTVTALDAAGKLCGVLLLNDLAVNSARSVGREILKILEAVFHPHAKGELVVIAPAAAGNTAIGAEQ